MQRHCNIFERTLRARARIVRQQDVTFVLMRKEHHLGTHAKAPAAVPEHGLVALQCQVPGHGDTFVWCADEDLV